MWGIGGKFNCGVNGRQGDHIEPQLMSLQTFNKSFWKRWNVDNQKSSCQIRSNFSSVVCGCPSVVDAVSGESHENGMWTWCHTGISRLQSLAQWLWAMNLWHVQIKLMRCNTAGKTATRAGASSNEVILHIDLLQENMWWMWMSCCVFFLRGGV